jgi:hypothetical protein
VPTGDSCTAANWRWSAGEIGVADYLWLVRGNTILNSVKSPASVSTSILSPCCFRMMSWLIDTPSPVPSPDGLVIKNGLNILSLTPSGAGDSLVVMDVSCRAAQPCAGRQNNARRRRET